GPPIDPRVAPRYARRSGRRAVAHPREAFEHGLLGPRCAALARGVRRPRRRSLLPRLPGGRRDRALEDYFSADDGRGATVWLCQDGADGAHRLWVNLGSSPDALTDLDGTLFFAADDGTSGAELWRSDGTAGGTLRVKDIRPGAAASAPESLTAWQG